jgi:hypothetical protein
MSVQSLYAMYVIGAVESNHNWTAINPSDPITLGMMQWYGNRAKSLILRGKGSDSGGGGTLNILPAQPPLKRPKTIGI